MTRRFPFQYLLHRGVGKAATPFVISLRKDFFILSFSVGYILTFGLVRLRTVRLSAWLGHTLSAGVHTRAGRI